MRAIWVEVWRGWRVEADIYEFDSFFSLTPWERVGLFAVSLAFAAMCAGVVWMVCRGRVWPMRVVIALLVVWVFVWVSPQGYYAYYRMIFEDLPPRLVIPEVPTPWDMIGHMTFTGRATLSSHTKGILGWMLVGLALLRR